MAMNLRGVRESGTAFAIPAYLFMIAILGMSIIGFARYFFGDLPLSESAELDIKPIEGFETGFLGPLAAFLLLRAFASGCATLTGVEAIANGVPAFRKPKGKNAATTLAVLGAMAITMALSIVVLANLVQVRVAEDPAHQLVRPNGQPVGESFHQEPVISQIAGAVFQGFPLGFFFVAAVTGIILLLAANTAFNGFPVLGSILGKFGYMPRQLHTRGDRLAFSNGILLLSAFAILLIVAFQAQVTSLIQLYIVGVFVSFTVGQTGMVRHWNKLLRTEQDPTARRRMQRSRLINGFGLSVTGVVLVVVLLTKFTEGAWISILAMGALFLLMRAIRSHYTNVGRVLEVAPDESLTKPSHVHAVVLVSKLHKPSLRALSFAKATRPDVLEAVTVDVDPEDREKLADEWDRRNISIPLKVLASPYREITRPLVDYIRSIRRTSPRHLVAVYVPEYVVGHWWEQLLHNQSALRLKTRLRFTPGVMVISVPYQLESSEIAARRAERTARAPGQFRRD